MILETLVTNPDILDTLIGGQRVTRSNSVLWEQEELPGMGESWLSDQQRSPGTS